MSTNVSGSGRRIIADPRIRQQLTNTIRTLRRQLFGLSSQAAIDAWATSSRQLVDRYSHLGLRAVAIDDVPAAVDALFSRMALRPSQRLLEVGPGAHGGLGLVASLMGLHVMLVETDRTRSVDVDLLTLQLSRGTAADTEAALAGLAGASGSVEVSQLDSLRRAIAPYEPLIAAAGGSLEIVAGDFANADVQRRVFEAPPFDHLVCTDVLTPGEPTDAQADASITVNDATSVIVIVEGLARAAATAQTLLIALGAPEQSDEFEGRIWEIYAALERGLRRREVPFHYEPALSPSSAGLLRARLYRFSPRP